eukprot:4812209-Amphidinium_carterae.2
MIFTAVYTCLDPEGCASESARRQGACSSKERVLHGLCLQQGLLTFICQTLAGSLVQSLFACLYARLVAEAEIDRHTSALRVKSALFSE